MEIRTINIQQREKIRNKHRCGKEPDLRRKCPECEARNFITSSLYGRVRVVKDGKTIRNDLVRQDAGSFVCKECGYEETY